MTNPVKSSDNWAIWCRLWTWTTGTTPEGVAIPRCLSQGLEYRMASQVDKGNQPLIPRIAKSSVCRYMAFPLTWPAKYISHGIVHPFKMPTLSNGFSGACSPCFYDLFSFSSRSSLDVAAYGSIYRHTKVFFWSYLDQSYWGMCHLLPTPDSHCSHRKLLQVGHKAVALLPLCFEVCHITRGL